MAERRMFAKTIVDSDAFLDMPLSTQALYFHLSMRADDDGFINNPKKIQRMIGASDDDLRLLLMKRFIIAFESGVVVIKHWKIHNYIRNDRYKETLYKREKRQLIVDEKNGYTEKNKEALDVGIPNGYQSDTQDRLGKDSIELGKDNILLDESNGAEEKKDEEPEKKPSKKEDQKSKDIKSIIDYLNLKAGTKYRANTQETIKHINARFRETFTLQDFFVVIDKKVAEWKGTNMEKFLRPQTLFGPKFESYLNAHIIHENKQGANGIKIASERDSSLDDIL